MGVVGCGVYCGWVGLVSVGSVVRNVLCVCRLVFGVCCVLFWIRFVNISVCVFCVV